MNPQTELIRKAQWILEAIKTFEGREALFAKMANTRGAQIMGSAERFQHLADIYRRAQDWLKVYYNRIAVQIALYQFTIKQQQINEAA